MARKRKRKMVWYEDYHRCGCSNIQDRKADLLGYCAKHGTSWKHRHRIPDTGFERGQVGH